MSLNKIVISGKLLEEPETRYTSSNEEVTRLSLQSGHGIRLKVACWRLLSEQAKKLKENDIVVIIGSLIVNTYKTQAGANRKDFEVNARELYRLSSVPESLNPSPASINNSSNTQLNKNIVSKQVKEDNEQDLSDILSDDEIPF